jgi:hypothetical protein
MATDDTAGPDQHGAAAATPAAAPAAAAAAAAPVCSREHMQLYYKRLFPAERMFSWLAYGNDAPTPGADASFVSRRELCFTLDGDVFARYQSFPTAAAFAAALVQRVPTKIDIGPVYTVDPRQRAKYARDFRPLQRELVFDVDLTDYDDVRTCGSGGHICARCWCAFRFVFLAFWRFAFCVCGGGGVDRIHLVACCSILLFYGLNKRQQTTYTKTQKGRSWPPPSLSSTPRCARTLGSATSPGSTRAAAACTAGSRTRGAPLVVRVMRGGVRRRGAWWERGRGLHTL